jgi:Tol biopolymer transport system component
LRFSAILTANLDRNIVQPHWSPDGKSVFAVLEDDRVQRLIRVPISGNAPETIIGGERRVTAYDVSKNGKVIVRASTPDRPSTATNATSIGMPSGFLARTDLESIERSAAPGVLNLP